MIFIDMDGVLVDWAGGVLRLFGSTLTASDLVDHNIEVTLGITNEQLWEKIRAVGPDFWYNLDKTPEYETIFELVRATGHPWCICTSAKTEPTSAHGKVQWLKSEFGNDFEDFVITSRKHLCAHKYTDVLIDDHPKNCSNWASAGGTPAMVCRPWSVPEHADDPLVYTRRILNNLFRKENVNGNA